MIYHSCHFITQQLNRHFNLRFGLNEDKVVLSNLVDADGSMQDITNGKLTVSLYNIQHQTAVGNGTGYARTPGEGGSARVSPPVSINLFLLFAANLKGKQYGDGLQFLSETVSYFQSNQVFTPQSNPEFPEGVSKLTLEIVNLGLHDLSHLWGSTGAKYIPSIAYKVRMLTFQGDQVQAEIPIISGYPSDTNPVAR